MRNLLICLFLAAVVGAVYARAGSLDFINYDDEGYVTENPNVNVGLNTDTFLHAFRSLDQANYHPLTWISLALDVSMFGLHPRGFHLENVLFHMLSTIFLFLFLVRATGNARAAAFAAAIFGVHPVHVESVAWVAERKDMLSALFFMLALLANLSYVRAGTRRRRWVGYIALVIATALGLLAKQMLVTLPFVLLLFDIWPLDRINRVRWSRLILEKVPLLVLIVLASIATFYAQQVGGAMMNGGKLPLIARIANACVSYPRYLVKIIWPAHLAIFYPYPPRWPLWTVFSSVVFLLAVSACCIWNYRRRPYLVIGWFFFLGTLVPVIGIVQIGWQSIADRYLYLPLIGPVLMLAWGGDELAQRYARLRPFIICTAALMIAAAAVVTAHQLQYWRNTSTLFEHDLVVTGGNTLAHVQLAYLDTRLGSPSSAEEHFKAAIRIDPTYFVSHFNYANLLLSEGRSREAVDQYRKAADDRPNVPRIENNWGVALLRLHQPRDAFDHFSKAERLDPSMVDPHFNLAQLLLAAGQSNAARSEFEAVLQIDPSNAAAKRQLDALR